jgi:peptide deformylase
MDEIRGLVPNMFLSMYQKNGIGLAAPQVDVRLRFFIMDVKSPIICINPTVKTISSEEIVMTEGCLSVPNQHASIMRPSAIEITYADLDGNMHELTADGLTARCIQHEIDHLNGIMFFDRIKTAP